MAREMSQSQKAKPALTPDHDSDCKEPCLTDNEAALILLKISQTVMRFSPHQHNKDGSRCLSQEPVQDKSNDKIQGLASEKNRDTATLQRFGHDSVATSSNTSSVYEYPAMNENAAIPGPLDETVSNAWSDDEYETAREETPSANTNHDSDERISDGTSDAEYDTARETTPSEKMDYDSDGEMSIPVKTNQNASETCLSTILDFISDGTVSDPESEDKGENALDTTLPTKFDHDLNQVGREATASKMDDSHFDATVSGPGLKENATDKMRKPHLCSLCKQPGHIRRHCPTIPCTYKGCKKRGHVAKNCPKRHKYNNNRQRSYVSRKRREAAAAQSKTDNKKLKRKSAGREYHCGLCNEVGHNCRACPTASR